MDTQTQVERLIELAIIQRAELKRLVEELPQLREHLNAEVERTFEETEPQLRAELEEFVAKQAEDKTTALGAALEARISELAKTLQDSAQAKFSAIVAAREQNADLLKVAEAKIAEAAAALPSNVKEIVAAELARFPRAGEIDQLRKEFAEPRGLNPRGKWTSGETYNRLDLVSFNGDSFVSSVDGNSEKPNRNGGSWTLSAARGAYGGGGGITSLIDLYNKPSAGQVLIGNGRDYVNANITAGNGISITNGAGSITIAASGGVSYQGTWDASANSPSLASGVGTKGYYYVVSVAGSTNLDGITDWKVGDWAIYNGTAWQKVDNTDQVSSVFGRTGAVVGVSTDYSSVGITNTAIGASNPSTGAFTTLSATGQISQSSTDNTKLLLSGGNPSIWFSPTAGAVSSLVFNSASASFRIAKATDSAQTGYAALLTVANTGDATLAGNLTVSGTGSNTVIANNTQANGTNGASSAFYTNRQGYETWLGTTGDGTAASYQAAYGSAVVKDLQGFVISNASSGLLLHAINGSSGIQFATGNTGSEKMRLTSNGNLLVNLSSSDGVSKVQVSGTGTFVKDTTDILDESLFTLRVKTTTDNGGLYLGANDTVSLIQAIDPGTSWNRKLAIQPNDGNLLVGTTTDSGIGKLQVNGSIYASSYNYSGGYLDSTGTNGVIFSGSVQQNFYTSGTLAFKIDSAQNSTFSGDLYGTTNLVLNATSGTNGNVYLRAKGTGYARVDTGSGFRVETGTTTFAGSALSTSNTGGVGYGTGAGGTVTQATSKTTGVTINRICGQIVTTADSIANNSSATFTVTNSAIAATDVVVLNLASGFTNASDYEVYVSGNAAGSFKVSIINESGGALAQALTLNFAIIKAVTS